MNRARAEHNPSATTSTATTASHATSATSATSASHATSANHATSARWTEQDIRARVGIRAIHRGELYIAAGSLFDTHLHDGCFAARCEGSGAEVYRVRAKRMSDALIEAECSCPVGESGGCKHSAALLLFASTEPQHFREIEPFNALCERADRGAHTVLARAMMQLRDRIPEMEPALRRAIVESLGEDEDPQLSRENPRRSVGEIFRAHAGDPDAANAVAAALSTLVAHGRACVARGEHLMGYQWFSAVGCGIAARARRFEDHDGTLRDLATSAFSALAAGIAQASSPTLARQFAIKSLFNAYRYDAEHGTNYARSVRGVWHKLGREDRAFAATLARLCMEGVEAYAVRVFDGALLDIEGELLSDDDFVSRCREAKRPREMLLRLLQKDLIEKAVTEAENLTESVVLEALEASGEFHCGAQAERLVAAMHEAPARPRLLSWWRDRLLERGDRQAWEAGARLFLARPDRLLWRQLRDEAASAWKVWRERLLAALERRGGASWVEALIDESMFEQALEAAKSLPVASTHAVRVELAERTAKTAAIPAADLLRTQADALIAQRGRANYREAARILRRARELYEGAGQRGLWVAYGESLRARAKEFPALKEELALSLARSSSSIAIKFDGAANDNADAETSESKSVSMRSLKSVANAGE